MKSGKRNRSERIELPNQEKIRTLGEEETCKCLETLQADTIKMHRWRKNNSGEKERYFQTKWLAGISSNE